MNEERDFDYISDKELEPHENQQVRRLWLERMWDREAHQRRMTQLKIWVSVFTGGAALFTLAATIRAWFK